MNGLKVNIRIQAYSDNNIVMQQEAECRSDKNNKETQYGTPHASML
jgi:hypothetical protein